MGEFYIISGNITGDKILKLGDVIVNPTNPMMRPGGGVSGDIFRKAGVDVLENYTAMTFGISYLNNSGIWIEYRYNICTRSEGMGIQ